MCLLLLYCSFLFLFYTNSILQKTVHEYVQMDGIDISKIIELTVHELFIWQILVDDLFFEVFHGRKQRNEIPLLYTESYVYM